MYKDQMEMFQEGGMSLKDEGGEIEEISGNDVPLGGTKKGVADDQPANLSVGELVVTEDVVRYHGVEKYMQLRDEAKLGYQKMEAMGQLGNSDEASLPDNAIFNPGGPPFSVVDLEYVDMEDNEEDEANNMQTGGLVPVQQSAPFVSRINPQTGLPELVSSPQVNLPQVLRPAAPAPITTAPPIPSTVKPPAQRPSRPVTQQSMQRPAQAAKIPTPQQYFGGRQSTNFFINEAGQIIQIPVVNNRQLYDAPEGFVSYDPNNPTARPRTPAPTAWEKDPYWLEEPRRRSVTAGGGGEEGQTAPAPDAWDVVDQVSDALTELDWANMTFEQQAQSVVSLTMNNPVNKNLPYEEQATPTQVATAQKTRALVHMAMPMAVKAVSKFGVKISKNTLQAVKEL